MERSLYPPDWAERSRAAIKRAGDKCEECGAPNRAMIVRRRGGDAWHEAGPSELAGGPEDGEYVTRVVLTVHHRIPARAGGSHEPENLISLCCRCHLIADGPLHARNAAITRLRKRMRHQPSLAGLELPEVSASIPRREHISGAD